ncbi:MAG: hypothetical protein J7L77_04475 [Clostridiales bacterium]|nr:hypothetical protein [Clostridiales bacterium]
MKGLKKGETELVFQYTRSWEEKRTIKEKMFKIKIK